MNPAEVVVQCPLELFEMNISKNGAASHPNCTTTRLLLLAFAVLFEELVQQHRIHRVVNAAREIFLLYQEAPA